MKNLDKLSLSNQKSTGPNVFPHFYFKALKSRCKVFFGSPWIGIKYIIKKNVEYFLILSQCKWAEIYANNWHNHKNIQIVISPYYFNQSNLFFRCNFSSLLFFYFKAQFVLYLYLDKNEFKQSEIIRITGKHVEYFQLLKLQIFISKYLFNVLSGD